MCFSLQRRAIFPHLNFKNWSAPEVFCTFWLENVQVATAACNLTTIFPHLNFEKCSEPVSFLNIFTCKSVSRYSGVPFFHIWTSKSGPKLTCFVHFHLKMCFSLQRRAIFRHQNFKKRSDPEVFCTFWLENVLLATAPCNFSTSELQKAVRPWGVLYIFTWKCASAYSAVQFFDIRTSKSGPTLRCFVHFDLKMCFSLPRRAIFRHQNFKKRSAREVFCTF